MKQPNPHADVVRLLGELRAQFVLATPNPPDHFDELTGEIETITKAYMVPSVDEQWARYKFSPTQHRLMNCLSRYIGRSVTTERLMDALYYDRMSEPPGDKNVHVQIHKCREKLKGSAYRIENAHGLGYRLLSDGR